MNEVSRRPVQTVAELASARQHHEKWPAIMERAVEGVPEHFRSTFRARPDGKLGVVGSPNPVVGNT
jgi:hypothetical protein